MGARPRVNIGDIALDRLVLAFQELRSLEGSQALRMT